MSAPAAMAMGTSAPPPAAWMTRATTNRSSLRMKTHSALPTMKSSKRDHGHEPAASDIGQTSEQGHGDRVAQQVAGDDPDGFTELAGDVDAEVGHQGLHDRVDHVLVERGHEDRGAKRHHGENRSAGGSGAVTASLSAVFLDTAIAAP